MLIKSRDVTVDVVIDVKSHFWVFLMLAIFFFRQIEKWNVLFEESSSSLEWWMEIQYIYFLSVYCWIENCENIYQWWIENIFAIAQK